MASLTPDETILGLLAVQARHGYELLDYFQDSRQLGSVWNLSTSQLYNVLKRLERAALVTGREVVSESGPPRIEYSLTEAGRTQLQAWLYDPAPSPSIRRVRVEFLSRLFIARALGLPTAPIIEHQHRACLAERERLLAKRARAAPGMETMTAELVLEQLAAVLRWIERCAAACLAE